MNKLLKSYRRRDRENCTTWLYWPQAKSCLQFNDSCGLIRRISIQHGLWFLECHVSECYSFPSERHVHFQTVNRKTKKRTSIKQILDENRSCINNNRNRLGVGKPISRMDDAIDINRILSNLFTSNMLLSFKTSDQKVSVRKMTTYNILNPDWHKLLQSSMWMQSFDFHLHRITIMVQENVSEIKIWTEVFNPLVFLALVHFWPATEMCHESSWAQDRKATTT